MKQLLGVFQIPEESKYQIEAVLNDFNADRPFRYRLSFSRLYRSLVDRFLGDPEFRSDLLAAIESSQIPIPVLTCPHCNNSTEGFYLIDPPFVIQCNKCTRTFKKPKEVIEYGVSKRLLDSAKASLTGVTDFEKVGDIKCTQCGALEVDQEIPEITENDRLNKQVQVKCLECGFTRNEFAKLSSRETFSENMMRARRRLMALDPKHWRVDE